MFDLDLTAWHQVLRGVSGTQPAEGSLETLWTGSTHENHNNTYDRSLTSDNTESYKSKLAELWTLSDFSLIDYVSKPQKCKKNLVCFINVDSFRHSY